MNSFAISRIAVRGEGFQGWGHPLFAIVMIALGVIGLYTGDVAGVWQRIPIDPLPGRTFFAYATAIVELLTGVGLLFRASMTVASAVLFVFLLIWLIALKVPAIVAVPSMEATWLGFGEIGVIAAGGWILFARHATRPSAITGRGGVRLARCLFAISLPMIGLSHFFYGNETAKFIPAYFPFPLFWAYLTGAGSLLTCAAVLTGVLARVAATLEAAMLVVITVFVWTPWLTPAPVNVGQFTAFFISSAIACGAWVVADSYRDSRWTARQKP
jgi:uncharacterized membrane protein YphA (DoxX/SURF4 family)